MTVLWGCCRKMFLSSPFGTRPLNISGSRGAGARDAEAVHGFVLRRAAAGPHLVDDLLLRSQRKSFDAGAIRGSQPSLK